MNKILFIAPLPPPLTGQSIANIKILENINDNNDVVIINYSKESLVSGVSSWKRFIEIFWLLKEIKRNLRDCNRVYLNLSQSIAGNIKDMFIILLCRNKKIFTHLHGGGLGDIVFKHSLIKKINKFCYKYVNKVIVLGDSLKKIYFGVVPEDKIDVVMNFYDSDLLIDENRLDKKNEKKEINILYLSNLMREKGYLNLLQSAKILCKDYPKLIFYFAGKFENESDEQFFLNEIESYENIKYSGILSGDNKKEAFWEANIFCLPTHYRYEGQPISILEAYSAGCCVVTTSQGGIGDIFQDKRNGLEVEKNNVEDLKLKLEQLINNEQELVGYGKNNYKTALSKFSEKIYIQKMFTILELR